MIVVNKAYSYYDVSKEQTCFNQYNSNRLFHFREFNVLKLGAIRSTF